MVSKKQKMVLMEVFGYNKIWIGQHHNQRMKALFPSGSTARKRFIFCTNQLCKWREFLLPNESTASLDLHLRSCPYASEDRSTTKAISIIEQDVSISLVVPIEPGSFLMTALILHHGSKLSSYERLRDRIRPLSQMVTATGDEPSYDKTLMVFKKEKMLIAEIYNRSKCDVCQYHAERNVCIKEEVRLVEDDSNSLVPIEPGGFLMTILILHHQVDDHGNNLVFYHHEAVYGSRIRPLSQIVTATGDEPSYDKTLMVFKKEKMLLIEICNSGSRLNIFEYHAQRLTDTVCNEEEMLLVEDDSTTLVPIEYEDILMTVLMRACSNPEEFHGVNYVVNKIRPLSQMVMATGDEPSYDKTLMVFKKEKMLLIEIFFYNITWISELHYQRIRELLTDWIARKRFITCTNHRCKWREFLIPIEGTAALDRHLEHCTYPRKINVGDFKRADLKQDDEESD
jgi:hypothetical protein